MKEITGFQKQTCQEALTDPFYSEANNAWLEKVTREIDTGKAPMIERGLIEE